jgi:hypothetical protein
MLMDLPKRRAEGKNEEFLKKLRGYPYKNQFLEKT